MLWELRARLLHNPQAWHGRSTMYVVTGVRGRNVGYFSRAVVQFWSGDARSESTFHDISTLSSQLTPHSVLSHSVSKAHDIGFASGRRPNEVFTSHPSQLLRMIL